MKFQSILFSALVAGLLFSCGKKEESSEKEVVSGEQISYTVDAESSVVSWKGSILGINFHTGTAAVKEGTLEVAGNQLKGGSFTVDLTKLAATDENYEEGKGSKADLIGHLSSPDFFSVAEFPTATFVVKSVEGNTAIGDLTVKGKTNEEKITDIEITPTGEGVTGKGKLVFDRQKYGVSFKVPGEVVLSDNIEVEISVVAKK
ncbi:MAG: YceI family protein [Cytophagales bacterium]